MTAPLVEEFIHRGMLFRGWRSSKVGLPGTLILTSALFTLAHIHYEAPVLAYFFIHRIFMGMVREKTGSVWVPVAIHMVGNTCRLLSGFF